MAQPDGKRPRRGRDPAAPARKKAAPAPGKAAKPRNSKAARTPAKEPKRKTKEELEAKPRFERRKAAKRPREEDQDQDEAAGKTSADPFASTTTAKPVKKRRWKDKLASTLFVNQLPYDVTELQIRKFFCSVAGISWNNILSVQMVGGGRSGGFKGIAFVELDSQDISTLALKLDKAAMWGRQINVRRAESKEEVNTAREERIKEARKQQAQASRTAKEVASTETEHAKRKFGDLAKAAPYLLKDGKAPAGTEDIDVLIERATMPRREKKPKLKAKQRGATPAKQPARVQQRSTWKDFSEKSRNAMRALPVVELKRRLNAFYKMDVDAMRDKNAAFLDFIRKPL